MASFIDLESSVCGWSLERMMGMLGAASEDMWHRFLLMRLIREINLQSLCVLDNI